MKVQLNEEQMVILKGMMEYAQSFCDAMNKVMVNHGLDKIEGCMMHIDIDPSFEMTRERISIGEVGTDFGRVQMAKGVNENKFSVYGRNNAEYELLFADEEIRDQMKKILNMDRETPPDGLWV